MNPLPRQPYVLITAARNEEAFIEKTIRSVKAQTIPPLKWVIVSDGSTDRTDDIVKDYLNEFEKIKFMRIDSKGPRNFKSKVWAFQAGVQQLVGIDYRFIGNVDADVSFRSGFFERLLYHFRKNSKLGIAGGTILELDKAKGSYKPRFGDTTRSVPGAVQLFRRQCFEQIGGLMPIESGGEDTASQITARMYGWEVESFPECKIWHHRRTGAGNHSVIKAMYREGVMDYMLGYHPLFQIAKCIRRIQENPFFVAGLCRMTGYVLASLRKDSRPVTDTFVSYIRREQMKRLKSLFLSNGPYC